MKVELFDYQLPRELVAQRPAPERDSSRLMVVNRADGSVERRRFRDLPELLHRGDLLVLNDTKVARAALHGRKTTGGRVEMLLLLTPPGEPGGRRAMLKSNARIRPGDLISVDGGGAFRVSSRRDGKIRFLEWDGEEELAAVLSRLGTTPLPPYIKRDAADRLLEAADRSRYQTVYAAREGAVAAPTAGLHFTRTLLERLADGGIETASVTLHVGLGTFAPIECEEVEDHRMHGERYEVTPAAAAAIGSARRDRRRVIAVGTTAARVLETAWSGNELGAGAGETDLYIHPPYTFKAVDAMITNFHLPRTTLLVMVAAFAGRELILDAYARAAAEGYRFYSYGDAMLIV